jgi:hypothetical protein
MHEAPKLETYWGKLEGHLLRMLREDWNKFHFPLGELIKINLDMTPLSNLASKAEYIGAVGRRISQAEVEIFAYRYDSQDEPTPINVYRYVVMESFPAKFNLSEMVNTASTCIDSNLEGYLTDFVFITQMYLPHDQHHLKELPKDVKKILKV